MDLPNTPTWAQCIIGIGVFSVLWERWCQLKAVEAERKSTEPKGATPNPFMSLRAVNYYRWRYIWPGIFLIPLRLVGTISLLIAASMAGYIACLGHDKNKPMKGVRKFLMSTCSTVAARGILACLGFYNIKVKGKAHPNAHVIVGNHRGPFEGIYLVAAHNCCLVSAAENRFPIVKHAMDGLQFIFVHRKGKGRGEVIETIKKRATEPGWPAVAMFPEGTTTNGKALIKFKKGAFLAGVPVQPVAFEFPNSEVDIDPSWVFGVHGPSSGLATVVLRLMSSWSNPMTVSYLPLAVPSEAEIKDPMMFAERVRRDIAKTLKIPCTEHAQEDVILAASAMKQNLSPSDAVVEFGKLNRLFNLTLPDAKDYLEKFKNLDTNGDGELDVREAARIFGLPEDGEILKGLFSVLNERQTDTINFKEFVMGMAKVSNSLSFDEKCSLCFETFDLSHDGVISREELGCMLRLGFSETTEEQINSLFDRIASSGPITFTVLREFLRENTSYLYLFDLLRVEAEESGGGLVPAERKTSFVRHKEALLKAEEE
eukprot:TRINITY_DN21075_c0_g1_i1.p1 TRINITY_DN21075_c0_g1~~TRINITY_DN21075_c0_g1_i1.p1  ORF type:complete len:561 (+),score=77.00 TRINITY_DN21075_c0_g1_i1:63-1685(+)